MEYSNANKETTMRLEANQGHRCFSSMTLPCALYLAAKVILSLRRKMLIAIVMSLALQLVQPVCAQQALQFPPTTKKTVSDEYHRVNVTEDYRWLEDFNDPAVRRWVDEQNRFSNSVLERIPSRTAIAN